MMKKVFAILLALCLLTAIALPASAETAGRTWDGSDFTLTLPEEIAYVFNGLSDQNDPGWVLCGIADPSSKLSEYREMNVIADFYNEDGSSHVILMKKESNASRAIFHLNDLPEEDKASFLESLATAQSDSVTLDKRYIDVNGMTYYRVRTDIATEQMAAHDVVCGTVVNGYALTFELFTGEKEPTQEQLDLLDEIVASVKFTELLEKPETDDYTGRFIMIVLLLLVVIVPLIYTPIRSRLEKKKKAEMAERISRYRAARPNGVSGEPRYANDTDCSKEAIHTFSTYHAYVKNIGSVLLGMFLCALVLAVAFAMDLEWWLKVAAVAVTIIYLYRLFTMSGNIQKIQTKVYQRGLSQIAHYAFFEDAFRVSGIQSASEFPYFQIFTVKKWNHYLYLYYGPENAYIVDMNGFTQGEAEKFEKFIRHKISLP